MYISIYSKKQKDGMREHLTNLSNVSFTLNRRTFDFNTFSATGQSTDNCDSGIVYIVNDDNGAPLYSGFAKNITKDGSHITFKGDDFRKLFDTEILLDFSQNEVQDFSLSGIFRKVSNLVTIPLDNDPEVNIIPIEVIIPEDATDTKVIADYTGQYFIKNAYSFLKVYLSYFNYFMDAHYDFVQDKIFIEFKKSSGELSIKLKDFINERTTTDISVNKTIATISYKTEDDEGNPVPRPQILPMKFYYLTRDNNIAEGFVDTSNRIYPVRAKIFENEYLAQAQYDAISELVDNRYVENILITNDNIYNPIDLADVELYTKINIYTEVGFYKTLPVSEKEISFTSTKKTTIIKLGFKRILFTEIVKGGK